MKATFIHAVLMVSLLLMLNSRDCRSQEHIHTWKLFFSRGMDTLKLGDGHNQAIMDSLTLKVSGHTGQILRRIEIQGFASPEGGRTYNISLANRRGEHLKSRILRISGVSDSLVSIIGGAVAWEQLKTLVSSSLSMKYRDEVLNILTRVPEETRSKYGLVDSRNRQLMELKYGQPYLFMSERFFSELRYATVTVVYEKIAGTTAAISMDTISATEADTIKTIASTSPDKIQDILPSTEPEATEIPYIRRSLFAVKTNMLYDLALTPNLEIEVPIGKRWSLNTEFQRGWWKRDDTFCWQIEAAGLEGRYWFGERDKKRVLTGWFAGVFAGGGFYDFQFKRDEGYQGEFYVMTGLSGGYAKQIRRDWSLEFSFGTGYITMDYKHYRVTGHELIAQGPVMRYKAAFLPLKAKISLVCLLHRNKKGGIR
ncbi:MAG: DUF3575 domain-containing protein [Prevotella sp.]|jgi:hypothetical protein|nr:DUF3575 domain-containing protein [Prevotella sp.]